MTVTTRSMAKALAHQAEKIQQPQEKIKGRVKDQHEEDELNPEGGKERSNITTSGGEGRTRSNLLAGFLFFAILLLLVVICMQRLAYHLHGAPQAPNVPQHLDFDMIYDKRLAYTHKPSAYRYRPSVFSDPPLYNNTNTPLIRRINHARTPNPLEGFREGFGDSILWSHYMEGMDNLEEAVGNLVDYGGPFHRREIWNRGLQRRRPDLPMQPDE